MMTDAPGAEEPPSVDPVLQKAEALAESELASVSIRSDLRA